MSLTQRRPRGTTKEAGYGTSEARPRGNHARSNVCMKCGTNVKVQSGTTKEAG